MAPPRSASDWLAGLRDELLPALARADLRIDVRVRLAIEAWLDAAARRGELPAEREGARNVLRAIVCKSARDQAAFDAVFEAWLHPPAPGPRPVGKGRQHEPGGGGGTKGEASPPAWVRPLGLLLLAAYLAAAAWGGCRLLHPEPDSSPPAQTVPPPPPASTASAAMGIDLTTVRPVTTPIEIVLPGTDPTPPPDRPPWLLGIPPAVYALLVLLLGGAGYTVRVTGRQQVARISVGAREKLRELDVFARQLLPPSGARRQALRDAARALRRPVPLEGRRLDLPASVQASGRAAGRFEPVWRERVATPDYLVLIDRSRPGEPFGQLAHEMARGLVAEGVSLQVFEFDRDPRWVAPFADHRAAGARRRLQPLATLEARHAGQGLLVYTDGQGFFDPATGTLHGWVAPAFAAWPRRALLTPVPVAGWGALEDLLAEDEGVDGAPAAAFLLLPAQTHALPALAEWFRGGEPEITLLPGAPGRPPQLLAGGSARWLSAHRPDGATVALLQEQLQGFLGPTAFLWLAASAAYPHVSADLTRLLAHKLGADDAFPASGSAGDGAPRGAPPDPRLIEARMLALAHLPWWRHGLMPDWLRLALLAALPLGVRERIGRIMRELFDTAGHTVGAGSISLGQIAVDAETGLTQRLRERVRDLRRRIGLDALADDEPEDSPLRDVIYLGVLRSDFDPALALEATGTRLSAMAGAPPRLTWNPLRWLAAVWVCAAFPFVLAWWAVVRTWREVAGTPRVQVQRREPAAQGSGREEADESVVVSATRGSALAQGIRADLRVAEESVDTAQIEAEVVRVGPGQTLADATVEATGASTPSRARPLRIFVSHRRGDARALGALVRALRVRHGIESFLDLRNFEQGMDWAREVEVHLRECDAVLAVIYGHTDNEPQDDGGWQAREVQFALDQGKPVVPVLLGPPRSSVVLPRWAAALAWRQAVPLPDFDLATAERAADDIGRILLDGTRPDNIGTAGLA